MHVDGEALNCETASPKGQRLTALVFAVPRHAGPCNALAVPLLQFRPQSAAPSFFAEWWDMRDHNGRRRRRSVGRARRGRPADITQKGKTSESAAELGRERARSLSHSPSPTTLPLRFSRPRRPGAVGGEPGRKCNVNRDPVPPTPNMRPLARSLSP